MLSTSLLAPTDSLLRAQLLCAPLSVILLGLTMISGPAFAAEDPPKPAALTVAANDTATANIASDDKAEANSLAASIEQALGVPQIKVQVFIKDGKRTAVLTGNLGTEADYKNRRKSAETRARKMIPLVVDNVISLLVPQPKHKTPTTKEINNEQEQIAKAQEVTAIWSRTFSTAPVDSTQNSPDEKNVTDKTYDSSLLDTLNNFYGDFNGKPAIMSQGSSVYLLRGTREKVAAIKRDLLKIDAVRPQVQLDMWTVQISGDPKTIAKRSTEIRNQFERANQAMQMVKSLLGDAAQNPQYLDKSHNGDNLLEKNGALDCIGFNPDPMRPLSLTETLIFLALQTKSASDSKVICEQCWKRDQEPKIDKRTAVRIHSIHQLQCLVADELNGDTALLKALDADFEKREGDKFEADPEKLLPNLLGVYSSNPASDRAGILQFAEATRDFADRGRSMQEQEDDIARLRATAAASDRLIKAATDSFAADMQAMFLKPIFAQISEESGSVNSGAVLTGQARMVVTSRVQTGIRPEAKSYVETTRPKPLDAAAFDKLFSQPQFALLSAALTPPVPEITEIAPGVAINVRPTVLPDGGSARLQLDFNFGVKSMVTNTTIDGEGRLRSVPADGIVSNHVKTDLTISAFELFNVSSFSIESSYPRSRYLPVIGSIPLLGELIKKPPKNKVTRHESLVLVNAIILPRVLDLTHFYGE